MARCRDAVPFRNPALPLPYQQSVGTEQVKRAFVNTCLSIVLCIGLELPPSSSLFAVV